MKTSAIFIRAAAGIAFVTTLSFCNLPAEQRGPETDTTINSSNTLRPDNLINADTVNQGDTAQIRRDSIQ